MFASHTNTSVDLAPLPPAAARRYGQRDSRRRPRPETLRDGKDFLHLRSTTLLSQMKRAIVQHRFSPAEQPRSAPLRDLHLFHVELAAPTGSKLLWVQVIGPGQISSHLAQYQDPFLLPPYHPQKGVQRSLPQRWIGRRNSNSTHLVVATKDSSTRQLDQTTTYLWDDASYIGTHQPGTSHHAITTICNKRPA